MAKGVGIGSASHAMGTSKAMEMGEIEGAMSSLSIAVSGLMTVVVSLIFFTYFIKGEKEGFMALQFVLGSSGAGKQNTSMSVWCGRQGNIRRKIIWVIVPEQFTMQTQKDLVNMHPVPWNHEY